MKATLLLLTLLGTLPVSLAAQTRLQPDRRIPLRFDATATSSEALELTTSELQLVREKLPALPADLPVSSSTEFRIRQSRTPLQGAKRGSTVGLVVGAGIGIFAGLQMTGDECNKPGAGCMVYDVVKAAAPVFGGILGAGAGAILGGVIGSVHPGERWVSVSLPL